MKKIFVFLALIVLESVCIRAQTETILGDYKIKGIVRANKADVIAGLNFFVSKGGETRSFVSNINGEFELSLQPGDYVITVNTVNSSDFKAFIKVIDKGLNPNNIEFVFDSSLACCFSDKGIPFPKPMSLPQPAYPPVARAVRATGEVVVNLKINKDGEVISAKATTGHPLLRATAEAAARRAKFEPLNTEDDIKVTYVFLSYETETPGINRYKNSYRVDVIAVASTVDY